MVGVNLCADRAPGWCKFMVFFSSIFLLCYCRIGFCCRLQYYRCKYMWMCCIFDVIEFWCELHSTLHAFTLSLAALHFTCLHAVSLQTQNHTLCLYIRDMPAISLTTQILYFRGLMQTKSANPSMNWHFDCDLWFPGDIYPNPFHSVSFIGEPLVVVCTQHFNWVPRVENANATANSSFGNCFIRSSQLFQHRIQFEECKSNFQVWLCVVFELIHMHR